MGAGTGNSHLKLNCIEVRNHTGNAVVLNFKVDGIENQHVIDPTDSYVLFMDKVEALSWEKPK